MILDHLCLAVEDFERSKAFYRQVLAPLGIDKIVEMQGWAGFGRDGKPEFWFGQGREPQPPLHFAFSAENRAQVREFHAAAIEAGATDNGAPGVRDHYHPEYYGAFVLDPDGHNIEAVCHRSEHG